MALINFSNENSSTASPQQMVFPATSPASLIDARAMGIDDLIEGLIGCSAFITNGQWSMYDFLLVAVEKFKPCDVYLSTYSMTEMSARVIGKLVQDGLIRNVTFLMDYKAEARYPNVHQILRNIGHVHSTQIHAKLLVIRSESGMCCSLLGSANWTKNRRIEAGVLDFSPMFAESIISFFKTFDHGTH